MSAEGAHFPMTYQGPVALPETIFAEPFEDLHQLRYVLLKQILESIPDRKVTEIR